MAGGTPHVFCGTLVLLLAEQEGIYIYQNTSALPIAMLCSEDIAGVSLAEQNPVALHNEIWSGLTGQSADILAAADAAFSLQNLSVMEDDGKISVYTKTDPSLDAAACWDIPVTESLPLYLYFSAPDFQETELWINGEYNGIYFDMDRWNMINAGTHSFTLRYLPRGLLPGAGLSACALCAACIWFILQRKKRTK